MSHGFDNLVELHRIIASGGTISDVKRTISAFMRKFRHGESCTISDAVYLPEHPVFGGVDTKGYSALHRAAYHAREDIAEVLLRCGASPNKRDASGKTPRQLVSGRAAEQMKALEARFVALENSNKEIMDAIRRLQK